MRPTFQMDTDGSHLVPCMRAGGSIFASLLQDRGPVPVSGDLVQARDQTTVSV
ncbi:hypothetical protein QFZ65_001849 [Arthrobacter sp. B3I9]|nr:hypothetical protein [Arthrobacter sp. B3I9]